MPRNTVKQRPREDRPALAPRLGLGARPAGVGPSYRCLDRPNVDRGDAEMPGQARGDLRWFWQTLLLVATEALLESGEASPSAVGWGRPDDAAVADLRARLGGPIRPSIWIERRPNPLSPREQEVAALIAQGYSNRRIAEALVITERTAETHARNIREKLGFTTRVQVAAWAVEQGLLAMRAPGAR